MPRIYEVAYRCTKCTRIWAEEIALPRSLARTVTAWVNLACPTCGSMRSWIELEVFRPYDPQHQIVTARPPEGTIPR